MPRVRPLGPVVLILLAAPASAADPSALASKIDRHLEADWAARGVVPAAPADDAAFARRVYLDIIGRTPRVPELRLFLDDTDPAKRAKLVDKLLTMPAHPGHFAAGTRTEWLPQSKTDNRFIGLGDRFERWLKQQYQENTPADKVARRVIAADIGDGFTARFDLNGDNQRAMFNDTGDRAEVGAFFSVNEFKPEQLAAAVTKLFLGVKLECAQCHDHPFAPYTRDQFWQQAAFFGDFAALPPLPPSFVGPLTPQYEKNRLHVPGTPRTAVAQFFDGSAPAWSPDRDPRTELADWVATKDNPFFARNAVNRMWARFFGIGLIDPVDEPGDTNPPSHPELLDELAEGFAESGFDNRFLIRAVTRSRAYQLTSRLTHPTQGDIRRFARISPRGLTGEQIFDSFAAATGFRGAGNPGDNENNFFFDAASRTVRGQFARKFPTAGRPTEAQTSILQALMLMNGKQMAEQTTLASAELLAGVQDAPFLNTEGKVETLFLAALSRKPTEDESQRFSSYVDRGGPTGDKAKALEDVFWALLNSTEFLFNH